MTPDERRVVTLLRSLYDWVPGPKTATGQIVARGALPGEAASAERSCPACGGDGSRRVRGIARTCDRCGGRGRLEVDGYTGREIAADGLVESIRSELELEQEAKAPETGTAATARDVRKRRQDAIADRLASADEEPADAVSAMLDSYERQYEAGDYRELECCLAILRRLERPVYDAVVLVHVLSQLIELKTAPRSLREPGALKRADAERGVAWLATRMRKPVRVPPWLGRELDETALWRGRSEAHRERRGERDTEIRRLAERGIGYAEIAARYGVSEGRVSQIVAKAS